MYMCMYGEVTVHNAIVYICCPVFAYMFVFPHLGDIVSIGCGNSHNIAHEIFHTVCCGYCGTDFVSVGERDMTFH